MSHDAVRNFRKEWDEGDEVVWIGPDLDFPDGRVNPKWMGDLLDALDEKDKEIVELREERTHWKDKSKAWEEISGNHKRNSNKLGSEIKEYYQPLLAGAQRQIKSLMAQGDEKYSIEEIVHAGKEYMKNTKEQMRGVEFRAIEGLVELLKSKEQVKCSQKFCELMDEHGDCRSSSGECVFSEGDKGEESG